MTIIRAPVTSLCMDISGMEITLGPGEHIVGRGSECSVSIDDPLASRRHAAITVTPESASIRDLGSRNGVLVNGEEIDDARTLVAGDLITLGSQAMKVLQIRRDTSRPRVHDTVPIARIALLKGIGEPAGGTSRSPKSPIPPPPVMRDAGLDERRRATTTQGGVAPFGQSAAAFRLITEAARWAVQAGGAERAEKILDLPLHEVLTALRAGKYVDVQVLDMAASEATMLCELTGQRRWCDYVHELFDARNLEIPEALLERLALAIR